MGDNSVEEGRRLYVGSLAYSADEQIVRDAFSAYGKVSEGSQSCLLLPVNRFRSNRRS